MATTRKDCGVRSIETRLGKLEALRLGGANAADTARRAEDAERAWAEAWAKAETDDDGPDGNRAAALRALGAQLEREAAAAEARRAARRRTPLAR
jgi:hypothetical protein